MVHIDPALGLLVSPFEAPPEEDLMKNFYLAVLQIRKTLRAKSDEPRKEMGFFFEVEKNKKTLSYWVIG